MESDKPSPRKFKETEILFHTTESPYFSIAKNKTRNFIFVFYLLLLLIFWQCNIRWTFGLKWDKSAQITSVVGKKLLYQKLFEEIKKCRYKISGQIKFFLYHINLTTDSLLFLLVIKYDPVWRFCNLTLQSYFHVSKFQINKNVWFRLRSPSSKNDFFEMSRKFFFVLGDRNLYRYDSMGLNYKKIT